VFVINTFYISGGSCVLLWGDNIVESFLFVLHHRQTLSVGLLNSLKKQEVREINVRNDEKQLIFRTEQGVCAAREAITWCPIKSERRLAQQIGVSTSTA
jgi:hypothetical protein